jgi:hypothetical protein
MSPFERAFASARRQGLKEFTFGGKRYHTRTREEEAARKSSYPPSDEPDAQVAASNRQPTNAEAATGGDPDEENTDNLLERMHKAVVAGGKDVSNVARLAVGLNELYPERPMGPIRRMGHTRTTTNKARNLVRRLRGLPELNLPDYNEVAFPDQDQYEGGFKK